VQGAEKFVLEVDLDKMLYYPTKNIFMANPIHPFRVPSPLIDTLIASMEPTVHPPSPSDIEIMTELKDPLTDKQIELYFTVLKNFPADRAKLSKYAICFQNIGTPFVFDQRDQLFSLLLENCKTRQIRGDEDEIPSAVTELFQNNLFPSKPLFKSLKKDIEQLKTCIPETEYNTLWNKARSSAEQAHLQKTAFASGCRRKRAEAEGSPLIGEHDALVEMARDLHRIFQSSYRILYSAKKLHHFVRPQPIGIEGANHSSSCCSIL
jgi:hypothetical protein